MDKYEILIDELDAPKESIADPKGLIIEAFRVIMDLYYEIGRGGGFFLSIPPVYPVVACVVCLLIFGFTEMYLLCGLGILLLLVCGAISGLKADKRPILNKIKTIIYKIDSLAFFSRINIKELLLQEGIYKETKRCIVWHKVGRKMIR